MIQRAVLAVLVIAVAVLGYLVHAQQQRIAKLDERLDTLRERSTRATPLAMLRTSLPQSAASAPPAQQAAAAPARAEPRVEVSADEVARVESAVLSLLERDHPELRQRLQAVVQEEQQAMQQQQRDARRERWVARREAKLLALSETAGVTPEQREAVLTIMLAQRDEVDELRRDAQTPEALHTLKDRIRAVRDQTDAQIRKQLTPAQYEAFRNDDGDEDERPLPAARAPSLQD